MGEESQTDTEGGEETGNNPGSDLVEQLIDGLAKRLGLEGKEQNEEELTPEESQVAGYHEHLGQRIESGAPIGRFGRPGGAGYSFKGLR